MFGFSSRSTPPLFGMSILKIGDYEPIITKSDEVDTFEVKLQPVPPEDLREEILKQCNGSKSRHK